MQRYSLIIGTVIALLGLAPSPSTAADPIGPVCFRFDRIVESFELFLMPSGGENYVITGRNRLDGLPVTGSGRLTEESFNFYFLTAILGGPGAVFEGELRLATETGPARFFVLNSVSTGPTANTIVSVFRCG